MTYVIDWQEFKSLQRSFNKANVIDIDAEKNRLVKTNEKLIKEISSMEGRLNNPKFVKSAPPEVVNETRENLEKRKEEEAQITNALKRLEEI